MKCISVSTTWLLGLGLTFSLVHGCHRSTGYWIDAERQEWERASPSEYDLEILENTSNRSFDLTLKSNTGRDLCLSAWPNSNGRMSFMSDHVYVLVQTTRHPIQLWNGGVCAPPDGNPRRCLTELPASGLLSASIPFSGFDPPVPDDPGLPRNLVFPVWAFVCPGSPFSFKFEPQQALVSIEAFLRSSISEPFSGSGVELSSDRIALALGEPLQVRPLGQVLAEKAVEILVRSPLP